jgi:hypothetical protein
MGEHALSWRKKRLNPGDEIITWWEEGDHIYVLWFEAERAARGEAAFWLDHMSKVITHAGHQVNGGGAIETIEGFERKGMTEEARRRLERYLGRGDSS